MNPFAGMRASFVIATLLYCAAIFWISAQPAPPVPKTRFPGDDKAAHAALYGGLAATLAIGLRRGKGVSALRLFFVPVIFASLYGVADEIHQHFVPPRTCDFFDWLADTAGALTTQIILFRVAWRLPLPWAMRGARRET
ncbi:MAG TPA: VanZ family protein [Candidatus Hydrogenedentes bacterium]|nr:VanZ family protein [Candidatus Hydrogenedentota bacterium]HOS03766.1 VanZ family protein [Candidatus Hydrogenedentota bacterium]